MTKNFGAFGKEILWNLICTLLYDLECKTCFDDNLEISLPPLQNMNGYSSSCDDVPKIIYMISIVMLMMVRK